MSTHRERTRARRTLRAGCSREIRRAARRSNLEGGREFRIHSGRDQECGMSRGRGPGGGSSEKSGRGSLHVGTPEGSCEGGSWSRSFRGISDQSLGASEGSTFRLSWLWSPRVPPPCSNDARVSPRWARASSRCRSRVLAPASLGREGPCGARFAPAYLALGRSSRLVFQGAAALHARDPALSRRPMSVGDAVGPPQMQQATPASSAGESPPCLPPCLPRVARGTRPTTTSRMSWRANDQICTA